MFEAHYASQPDYPVFSSASESSLTRRLHSYTHGCPLHVWAARGKRKNDQGIPQPHWFLYIEYCRLDGARDWLLIERPCAEDIHGLFDAARWLELPAIDPQRTRNWLDLVT